MNATASRARKTTLKADAKAPRLVIMGRGQLHGRRLHAIRLKDEITSRLQEVASGPLYLLVEVAMLDMIERLEKSDELRLVRAEDLG